METTGDDYAAIYQQFDVDAENNIYALSISNYADISNAGKH